MNGVQGESVPLPTGRGRPETVESEPAKARVPHYPGFWALFLLVTTVGAVTSVRYHFMGPARSDEVDPALFVACIVYLYPWIGLAPVVFRLEGRFPLGPGTWPRNVALLAAWSVPVCLVASPAMNAIVVGVLWAFGGPTSRPFDARYMVGMFPIAEAMFWSGVAGGYFIRTLHQLREQERRAARLALEKSQLEAGLNQAQLEVLRSRLNPHFLFNSLQNISVMIGQDPPTASRMVTRLGDLLRAVLRQDSQPETTLQEEIALTRSYVALEQMRFGDRLHVGFEIGPGAQMALVPSFLLQPLIENAVVHGLRGARKTGVITVSAAAAGNELVLTVTDNGIGPPPQPGAELKVGVGLGSTCERLARMYPDRHTFSMRRPPQGGAEVRISIPLRLPNVEDRPHHDEQLASVGS
jgi:two-component system, LytTR family, sensor kinase